MAVCCKVENITCKSQMYGRNGKNATTVLYKRLAQINSITLTYYSIFTTMRAQQRNLPECTALLDALYSTCKSSASMRAFDILRQHKAEFRIFFENFAFLYNYR